MKYAEYLLRYILYLLEVTEKLNRSVEIGCIDLIIFPL
ncbi:MAG: hypothetical protein A4E71_01985 [Smithella sp. PtaU1.Bin162]|nr:MAG: hypothetical protein A4E71_01985 [Smithella sp. PtaU1.Bin162]